MAARSRVTGKLQNLRINTAISKLIVSATIEASARGAVEPAGSHARLICSAPVCEEAVGLWVRDSH